MEHAGEPFFAGEVEPCINGRTVALGAYYGVDVAPIVQRLLGEQMDDGGWNCEQENGSTRGSFHTTIEVLEGLSEYAQAASAGGVGDADGAAKVTARSAAAVAESEVSAELEMSAVSAAIERGQQYLLKRQMFRRLSTGEPIETDRQTGAASAWTQFSYPTFWHYDLLRGLDYLRAAGVTPDKQVAEAVEVVRSKQEADGRWLLENPHPGELHFPIDDGEGEPSRWNTLRAMRVLKWYDEQP